VTAIKKQFFVSILTLGGAVAVSFLLYLNRPPARIAEPAYQPVSVDVATVVKETIRLVIQAQGTVTPLRETAIMAEVSGRVIEVAENFVVGGFVAKDDVLLRIDPRDYQTSLLRAQAAVESAESTLAQEKGRAEVALREWQKLPTGSQRSQEAKDLYLRKPQLEQAEAQVLAAMADLNTARDNLGRTIIKAPYDALIRAKHSELGEYVGPGTALADVFSVDFAEVRLPVPQTKLEYLELPELTGYEDDRQIDLYTDVAGDVTHWTAILHRTEAVFDERSRVLYLVARIEDPYALKYPGRSPLRLGTFINASIQGRELPGLIALPRHTLRPGNSLWVVDSENILRSRAVTVLRTGGDRILVSGGLDEGERVSLTSVDSSLNGSRVVIASSTPSNRLPRPGQPPSAQARQMPAAHAGQPVTAALDP